MPDNLAEPGPRPALETDASGGLIGGSELHDYNQEEVLAGTIFRPGDRTCPGGGNITGGIEAGNHVVADWSRLAERSSTQQPMPRLWDDGRAICYAKHRAPDSLLPSQTRSDLCGSRAWEASRVPNSPLPAL